MGKIKFHWQLLGLIFILLLASCLPASTLPDNQNALETIVATTLTAIAGEAPGANMPDVTTPVETVAPDVPTFIAPRALQVAYIKNGNVYVWTEDKNSVGLTNTGDAVDVRISDDGQVIVYTRRDPNNDFAYELWAVNTSGPTNARLLVSNAELEALKATSPFPDARGLRPDFFEFQPKTHQLAYSTIPLFEGPGYAPGKDLRLVNTDNLEKITVFDFNGGGLFYFSPNGAQVALSNPDHISLANADGSNLRPNVLTFPLVGTYSEYQYHPRPHWSADSSFLRVAIPPEDTLAQPTPPTMLWHIPTDGSPATQLGSIPAIPFAWPDTAFSPNLDKVGYAKSVGEPDQNQRELHIANADGSGDFVVATGEGVEFWQWTPDGERFLYVIHAGAEQGAYLGQLSGGSTLIASIPTTLNQMRWVDASRFLYLQPNGNAWELRISDVDGQNHAFIDTVPDSVGSFDFTQ
ncbi:MAG: hypothetical protein JW963_20510 [Anaerolineales bacterium]|nr:hypothetical protein [Anaerolineales bacterium]